MPRLARTLSVALIPGALALGLAAVPETAQPSAPPPAFAQCAGCHSLEPGKHLFGPSLAGLAGRKAGSLPGYSYSAALKGSGLTWNAQTLDRWLTSPRALVPGTKMPFLGLSDATKRKQLVAFLTERP